MPNYRPLALGCASLSQSSAWRGHWVDITGYYNVGLRPYDPVSGRWLTYDSAWNGADPNYYSFCGGDPINGFDPDGRMGAGYYAGLSSGNVPADASPAFMAAYYGGGVTSAVGGQIISEAQAANSPTTYINGALSFGNNISSYYQSDGIGAASSYALTSWNVGAIYSGYENFDLSYNSAGQSVGDLYQRAELISGGVASTASTVAPVASWGTATIDSALNSAIDESLPSSFNIAGTDNAGAASATIGVQANQAAGAAWEEEVINNVLPKTQENIQPQITIQSSGPSGLSVRLDAVGTDQNGAIVLTDAKASATAPLTQNQDIVYPELPIYGGIVVGAGKPPYVGGTVIQPTTVNIIRQQ